MASTDTQQQPQSSCDVMCEIIRNSGIDKIKKIRNRGEELAAIYRDMGEFMRSQIVGFENDFHEIRRDMTRVRKTKYDQLVEFNRQIDEALNRASQLEHKIGLVSLDVAKRHTEIRKEILSSVIKKLDPIAEKVYNKNKWAIDEYRQREAREKEKARDVEALRIQLLEQDRLNKEKKVDQVMKEVFTTPESSPPPLSDKINAAEMSSIPRVMIPAQNALFIGGIVDGQSQMMYELPTTMLNLGQTKMIDTPLLYRTSAGQQLQIVPVYFFYKQNQINSQTPDMIKELVRAANKQAIDKNRSQIIGAFMVPLETIADSTAFRVPEKLSIAQSIYDRFVFINVRGQLNGTLDLSSQTFEKLVYNSNGGGGALPPTKQDSKSGVQVRLHREFFAALFAQIAQQYTATSLNKDAFYTRTHLIDVWTTKFTVMKTTGPGDPTTILDIGDVIGIKSKNVPAPPQNAFQVVFGVAPTQVALTEYQGKITRVKAISKDAKITIILDNILSSI